MGSSWLENPKPLFCLAPMDGCTHLAYRRFIRTFCKKIILFTEFTYANSITAHPKEPVKKIARFIGDEPVVAQIYGKEVPRFIQAAKILEDIGFAGIDLNMGCPSRLVVQSEHGIALRKKPEMAFRLVDAVANAVKIPVSVKTRLGWDDASDLESFAEGVENAGAKALTIHARTYQNSYSTETNWEPIYRLKEKRKLTVIGNGSVESYDDGIVNKIKNLDGVMIGRSALRKPWVILPENLWPKTDLEKYLYMKKQIEFLWEANGNGGLLEARGILLKYFSGSRSIDTKLMGQIKMLTTPQDWLALDRDIISVLG